jgi:1-acyl-sn-glycerol-3-phosphate acyltransferase
MTTVVKLWLSLTGKLIITKHLDANVDIRKRYVYISNHASYLDPIVMWSVMSLQQRLNGAPTKVMTSPGVYFSSLRPLIWLLGAFPAKKRDHQKLPAGVEGALHYIRSGYNICIFPEGKRAHPSEKRAFNGVSRILAESDDCEMILIRIIWYRGKWWQRNIELRASPAPATLDRHDPMAIMEHIYNL